MLGVMDAPNDQDMGLRARKRLATQEALGAAALRLALERGLENVRVDDIAAAAGVSVRTYNNYFSSRKEAVCALAAERAQRVGAALRARPVGEALGDAIIHAMVEQYAGAAEPDRVGFRLLLSTPALQGAYLATVVALERPLAAAIAARAGMDGERDLVPRVLAAAVASAARVATEDWVRPDNRTPFAALLRDALRALDGAGLWGVPHRSRAPVHPPHHKENAT